MNYKVVEEEKKVLAIISKLTNEEFETIKKYQFFGYEVENVTSLKKKKNADKTWKKDTLIDWLKDNKTDNEVQEFKELADKGYFKALQWFKKEFKDEYK